MSIVFYWPKYFDDQKNGLLDYSLNQKNEKLHDLRKGEHIWAFTRRRDKVYVLAADLIVEHKLKNGPQDPWCKYGSYRVVGDRKTSRYFDIELCPDIEDFLRSIFPLKSNKNKYVPIGQSFQGLGAIKFVDEETDDRLIQVSKNLPLIKL